MTRLGVSGRGDCGVKLSPVRPPTEAVMTCRPIDTLVQRGWCDLAFLWILVR